MIDTSFESVSPRSGGGVGQGGERAGAFVTATPSAVAGAVEGVDVVAAFVGFVRGDEGRAVVAEHGFGLP
jgi:hypothetical protein